MNCEKPCCKNFESNSKNNCTRHPDDSDYCIDNDYPYYDNLNTFHEKIELKNDAGNKFDNVNKPKHYNQFQTEVIDVIKSCLTKEEFTGYLKGNLIKYRMRAGFKENRDEDLNKSNWYQDKLEGLK